MKKYFFCIAFSMLFGNLLAQEQITGFENKFSFNINAPVLLDTLNGKALFTIYTREKGTEIYSTDGAEVQNISEKSGTNTEWINKDLAGRLGRNLYFLGGNKILKTNGDSLIVVYNEHSESLINLQKIGKSIYAISQFASEQVGLGSVPRYKLIEFNSEGQTTIMDSSVYHPIYVNNTFHYVRKTPSNRTAEIVQFGSDQSPRIITTYRSENNQPPHFLRRLKLRGIDAYLITDIYNSNTQLLMPDSVGNYQSIAWGQYLHSYQEVGFKGDSVAYVALLTVNKLDIYEVTNKGFLSKRHSEFINKIKPPNRFNDASPYLNVFYDYDRERLFYFTIWGAESISDIRLNEYDFKTSEYRNSSNLLTALDQERSYRYIYYPQRPEVVDNDIYRIESRLSYMEYDLAKDKAVNITRKPLADDLDPVFTANLSKGHVLISNAVYRVEDHTKTTLFEVQGYFSNPRDMEGIKKFEVANRLMLIKPGLNIDESEVFISSESGEGAIAVKPIPGRISHVSETRSFRDGETSVFLVNHRNFVPDRNQVSIYELNVESGEYKQRFVSGIDEIRRISDGYRTKEGMVYLLSYLDDSNKLLFISETSTTIATLPASLRHHDIIVTESDTYLTNRNRDETGNLYYLQNNNFILLEDKVINTIPLKNKLLCLGVIKETGNNQLQPDGVFYYEGKERRNLQTGYVNGITNGSRYGLFGNTISAKVFDSVTGEVKDFNTAVPLRTTYPFQLWEFKESYAVSRNNIVEINHLGSQFRYVGELPVNHVEWIKGGLLISENAGQLFSLSFFSFEKNEAFPILDKTPFRPAKSDIESDIVLVDMTPQDGAEQDIRYYTLNTKELKKLAGDEKMRTYELSRNIVIEADKFSSDERNVYVFDGLSLKKQYSTSRRTNIKSLNGLFYIIEAVDGVNNYLPLANVALVKRDSLQLYEVRNNSRMIQICENCPNNIFEYKNQLYVHGFTVKDGTQVWRIGEVKQEEQKQLLKPLAAEETFDVNIYPNPTSQLITIESFQNVDYQLINMSGVSLKSGKVNRQETIDLKDLPTGIYILNLYVGGKNVSRKVVKVN